MSTIPLPERPNVEQLRKQARELQKESGAKLTAAQFELAQRYGFPSWSKLVKHVELVAALTREPHAPQDDFVALACLRYGNDEPGDRARAAALLAADPSLASRDVWSAAATASVDAVRGFAVDASRPGGPFDWEPLMYLCYSRQPASEADTLATARVLLDAGADPNVGYLWHGLPTPFTALTGVFGEGEQGPVNQPSHPHCFALARLLLERGANANDAQTLYNRMFQPGNAHLELLFEFGLGQGDGGPWRQRLGAGTESIDDMFRRQLDWAAVHNLRDRMALLLDHGVDMNMFLWDGVRAIDRATTSGHMDLVGDLYERGAEQSPLDAHEALPGFVLSMDRANVQAMLDIDADVVAKARALRPSLVVTAAANGSIDALRYATELGWDVDALGRSDMPIEQPWQTALHTAVERDDAAMVAALLAMGADPSIEDARFHSTPKGWAEHFGTPELAALFP